MPTSSTCSNISPAVTVRSRRSISCSKTRTINSVPVAKRNELLHTGAGWLHSFDAEATGRGAPAGGGRRAGRGARNRPAFCQSLVGQEVGHEVIVITWLHQAKRDVL